MSPCVFWSSTTPKTDATSPRRCFSPPDIEQVITAGSAKEAYRLLELGGPATQPAAVDLVLLDIVMPEIDGIEACARIRNDPRYRGVPDHHGDVAGDIDSLANAFVAGATDYITKPVNRVELLARVRSALKLKAELDRRQARERELMQIRVKIGQQPRLELDRRRDRPVGRRGGGSLSARRREFPRRH